MTSSQILLAIALGVILVVNIGIIGWRGKGQGPEVPPSTGWNLVGLLAFGVVVGLLLLTLSYFLNRAFVPLLAWTGLVLFFLLAVLIVLINRR
ncbi:MAG TPA: hypothetical protein VGS09_08160 [Actinomycetota bacterium]|nr:hypothetical protein [Actinomycetota bacterium]